VVGQRGLHDLLLHLAVQGDVQLLADVVLAQVDQRVLLGELAEGGLQPAALPRRRNHDRLQRRRREVLGRSGARGTDGVADPHLRSPHSLPICPAWTDGRATTPPRSNTPMPVTFWSPVS